MASAKNTPLQKNKANPLKERQSRLKRIKQQFLRANNTSLASSSFTVLEPIPAKHGATETYAGLPSFSRKT